MLIAGAVHAKQTSMARETQISRTRSRAGLMAYLCPKEGPGAPLGAVMVWVDRLAAPPARIIRSSLPLLARI